MQKDTSLALYLKFKRVHLFNSCNRHFLKITVTVSQQLHLPIIESIEEDYKAPLRDQFQRIIICINHETMTWNLPSGLSSLKPATDGV